MAALHLTVIAKRPVPGLVKTRLCPPCTPSQAAELAAAALADTLDAIDLLAATHARPVRRVLLFDGDPTGWLRQGYELVAQRGEGLAARLANGFDELGPGVIVGMETPHGVAALAAGLDALAGHRDVIGLATDGGYWAIGLHRADRRVFESIPMSESNTGLSQLRRLHSLGRSVSLLPMLRDLDTFDDVIAAAGRDVAQRLTMTSQRLVVEAGASS